MHRRAPAPGVAALFFASLALAAEGPAPCRGGALPAPPARSATLTSDAGIVALSAPPRSDRVFFPRGSFTMGSVETEATEALALCAREGRVRDCTLPSDFALRGLLAPVTLEELVATELVAHDVYLSGFWLDRREVTVADYSRCAAAGPCPEPPYGGGGERFRAPDLPVSLVTWAEARTYCEWQGGRLPTEAEWERAARGTMKRRFPWGNNYHRTACNHGGFTTVVLPGAITLPDGTRRLLAGQEDPVDGFAELAPVGTYVGGRTPEGLDDMAGNVAEWVADYFADRYEPGPVRDPKGPTEASNPVRVARGGSYMHGAPLVRTTARMPLRASERQTWLGFRCASER